MTRTVVLLAAAGSGKTSLISDIVRHNKGDRSVAVVFNDDGDPAACDLPDELGKYADITSMTAGCFGCADAAAFLDRIEALRDAGVDLILVEPVGFIDAHEMLGTLAEIGVRPTVIAIVDAAHHARNLQIGTTEGHVLAAHHVLVSKMDRADPEFDTMAWAQERCHDVRPYHLGDDIDIMALMSAQDDHGHSHHDHHDHGHDHHGHHDHHDHGHDHHDHGHHDHSHFHVAFHHLRLGPDVQLAQVQAVLADYPEVLRAKGDLVGLHFDLVQGTWRVSDPISTTPYITFYTTPSDASQGEACLDALRPYRAPGWVGLTGTAAATRGEEVDVGTVRYQLDLCTNKPLTFSGGHPVPNPQWQELLNELRKRPGVPEDLQAACVVARVEHYLKCARWYRDHPDRESDPVAPVRLHAVAVGVAWFVSEMAGRLTDDMLEEAREFAIARWLWIGLRDRQRLNRDVGKERVIADEAGVTARWALGVGQTAPLHEVWDHNLRMAEATADPRVIDAWKHSRPEALMAS